MIHHFSSTSFLPNAPAGGILINNDIIYKVTQSGGANNYGAVYSIHIDGTGFTNLHSFDGTDGSNPISPLLLVGSKLYGSTQSDSVYGSGILFSIETNGSNYEILHLFDPNTANEGAYPMGQLVESGGLIYGVTMRGGSSDGGTIYSVKLSDRSYTQLYHFSGNSNSMGPEGGLIIDGTNIYGMTPWGGTNEMGTVFRFQIGSGNFSTLYEFTNEERPSGRLVIVGGLIYGFATGFKYSAGSLFTINTDGSDMTTHYTFSKGVDGWHINGAPVIDSGFVYGTSMDGGDNDYGTIFKIALP